MKLLKIIRYRRSIPRLIFFSVSIFFKVVFDFAMYSHLYYARSRISCVYNKIYVKLFLIQRSSLQCESCYPSSRHSRNTLISIETIRAGESLSFSSRPLLLARYWLCRAFESTPLFHIDENIRPIIFSIMFSPLDFNALVFRVS